MNHMLFLIFHLTPSSLSSFKKLSLLKFSNINKKKNEQREKKSQNNAKKRKSQLN